MNNDETHEEYRARDGVNWSRLKLARTSALHYRDTPPRKDSASLGMLRAVHALVLEPQHFDRDFAVYQGANRRGKVWTEYLEAHAGKTILKRSEHAEASAIADAVRANPHALAILEHPRAEFEVSMSWNDAETGLRCKGRADIVVQMDGESWLIDLKTVRSIQPRVLASDAAKLGYHGQLAHYAAGESAMFGSPVTRIGLLCVESKPPHDVALYWLDDEARDAGRALRDRLLRIVADAAETGDYPGQCPEPATLSLPAWALDSAHGDTFTGSET
jgi:hypothetical protein